MLNLLVTLVIYGLVLAIIWWAIQQVPMPEPFSWVVKVVFALVVVIILLGLLGVGGDGLSIRPIRLVE